MMLPIESNSKAPLEKELNLLILFQQLQKLKESPTWLNYLADYRLQINNSKIDLIKDCDDSVISIDEKSNQELELIKNKQDHWLFTFCEFSLKEIYLLYTIPISFFNKYNICIFNLLNFITSKKFI